MLLTIPSLLLFIPINDVFLPLFPLGSFFCFIIGNTERKKYFLFVSGIIFSLGIFFSLSLLPLLFVFLLYLLWIKKIRIIFQNGLIFTFGLITLPIVLFVLYGYNSFTVSQTLLSGLPEGRMYLPWVFFNLLDYFVFLGIPLFIYFCLLCKQMIENIVSFQFSRLDCLTVGSIGMVLLLDLSGSVRGEVARIWIPFYPFFVIILAVFLSKQLKLKKNLFVFLLVLQFLQVLFMQEFWVMLW
jgi:hypothetical protein